MSDFPDPPWVGFYYDKYRNDFYGLVEREEYMSDLWAYDEDRCEGDYCPMNCDTCPKSEPDYEEDEDE